MPFRSERPKPSSPENETLSHRTYLTPYVTKRWLDPSLLSLSRSKSFWRWSQRSLACNVGLARLTGGACILYFQGLPTSHPRLDDLIVYMGPSPEYVHTNINPVSSPTTDKLSTFMFLPGVVRLARSLRGRCTDPEVIDLASLHSTKPSHREQRLHAWANRQPWRQKLSVAILHMSLIQDGP